MKSKICMILLLTFWVQQALSQTYPTFGPAIKVTITGLTFDAMEPFISLDGNTLYFNSLNSGGNTNLYYATKADDSTFTYIGLVGGTYDPSPNHLDAVPSMDTLNNFYWVSLRSMPNLHRGNYLSGNVTNITRTYGDFNIFTPGWIIMDAAISHQGDLLYYCNADFGPTFTECVGIPCQARLGVAQKVNDSTFNKITTTEAIFYNINDTNYVVYAPQATRDGLELYFTRILKNTLDSEICVAVRNSITDTFSLPAVIHSNLGFVPEAASPSTDKQKIYYHEKDGTGTFGIYLRYRTAMTALDEQSGTERLKVYPNPTNTVLNVILPQPTHHFTLFLYSTLGQELFQTSCNTSIDISLIPKGIYYLKVNQSGKSWKMRILKE